MNFKDLLLQAKDGSEQATTALLEMYQPLLIKNAIIDNGYDEDLHQELCITLLKCIKQFNIQR